MTVSSASKFSQSSREAPSSVEVISREDIRRHGWRTLTEVFSSLTGTYIANDRVYDYGGARGFLVPGDLNTRFLVMIDGQRINDNIYEQAAFSEEFPLDLALVERVEYVPGPGSSIYGSNAIFGVVNVITRRAEEMSPLTLASRFTQDGWGEARATFVRRFESGASFLFAVTSGHKSGRDQTYSDPAGNLILLDGSVSPDGATYGLDAQHNRQIFARYENGGFSVTGRYSLRRVQPSSAPYGTLFGDPGLNNSDVSSSLLGRYQKQVSDVLGIDARLEFGQMIFFSDFPYDDGTGNRYISRDDTLGQWWNGELRVLHTGFADHKIVGGVEVQTDISAQQRNYPVDVVVSGDTPIDADHLRHRGGMYVQDEWVFAPDWRLNAGLRHDVYSDSDSATSPRLGLIWLASEATTLKLIAGNAYRVPNAYERDYANGASYLSNPSLRPETMHTVEAVVEQRIGRQHSFRVSLFDYHLDSVIVQVDTGGEVMQYQNQGRAKAHGVEMAWRSNWESGAQLLASFSLTDSDDGYGNRPGFSPRWIGKLRGSIPVIADRWLLNADARVIGATEYQWGGTSQQLGTQAVVDASLTGARLAAGLDGYLRVRNIFDRRFDYPGSEEVPVPRIPGNRRAWEIGLRYAF